METVVRFQHPPPLEQASSVPGNRTVVTSFSWKHNWQAESEHEQIPLRLGIFEFSFMLTWHDDAKLRGLGFEPDLCHHVRAKSDTITTILLTLS